MEYYYFYLIVSELSHYGLISYVINDFKLKLDSYIFSNTLGKDYKYLINTSSSVLFGNMEKSELASGSVFGLINLMSSLILSLSVISFIFILKL